MSRPPRVWLRKQTGTYYTTLNGKQIPLGKNRKKANENLAAIVGTPRITVAGGQSIAAAMDAFLGWTQKNRAPATYDNYVKYLQSFLDHAGDIPVASLKPLHVQKWCDSHDWGPTTCAMCVTIVKRAMNWARRMGFCAENPIADLERPQPNTRTEIITPSEFNDIMSHVTDQEFRDLLTFSWETSSRPKESRRLEARHLELDKSRAVYPYTEGKSKKIRVIYLTDTAKEIVTRLAEKHPQGCLFRNASGTPWTAGSVSNRFCRLKPKLGGRKFHQYQLRHSWITRAIVGGADSHIVAKLAGHADTKMLDKVYSHISDDHEFMLDAAKKVVGE